MKVFIAESPLRAELGPLPAGVELVSEPSPDVELAIFGPARLRPFGAEVVGFAREARVGARGLSELRVSGFGSSFPTARCLSFREIENAGIHLAATCGRAGVC